MITALIIFSSYFAITYITFLFFVFCGMDHKGSNRERSELFAVSIFWLVSIPVCIALKVLSKLGKCTEKIHDKIYSIGQKFRNEQ